MIGHALAFTPHTFIIMITTRKTKVAEDIPKLDPQYWENTAAAIVKVVILMQLASLDTVNESDMLIERLEADQYITPTVKPRAYRRAIGSVQWNLIQYDVDQVTHFVNKISREAHQSALYWSD